MGYAYDESPFVPLPTTTSGNSRPTEAMKDAEIAKLRAENNALRTDCARISAECGLPPTMAPADGEVAKVYARSKQLAADLDEARRDRNSAVECAEVLRGYVAEHKAALAAARAALDGYKSPEAAHNLAMRAIEESHRANRAEAALKDCRAALDGEREALSTAHRALANISGCGGCENCGDIASKAFACIDARRAAESNASRGGEGKP